MKNDYPYFKGHRKRKYTQNYLERILVKRETADNLIIKDESNNEEDMRTEHKINEEKKTIKITSDHMDAIVLAENYWGFYSDFGNYCINWFFENTNDSAAIIYNNTKNMLDIFFPDGFSFTSIWNEVGNNPSVKRCIIAMLNYEKNRSNDVYYEKGKLVRRMVRPPKQSLRETQEFREDYPEDYPTREDVEALQSELQDYVGIHMMENGDVDEFELLDGMMSILQNNGIKAFLGWEEIVVPLTGDEIKIKLDDNEVRIK